MDEDRSVPQSAFYDTIRSQPEVLRAVNERSKVGWWRRSGASTAPSCGPFGALAPAENEKRNVSRRVRTKPTKATVATESRRQAWR
jgi:hypothetical protein